VRRQLAELLQKTLVLTPFIKDLKEVAKQNLFKPAGLLGVHASQVTSENKE
jgi:hypothetical protein